MKSIELKELRSEVLGELEVIQKTAEAEDNRDLTERKIQLLMPYWQRRMIIPPKLKEQKK